MKYKLSLHKRFLLGCSLLCVNMLCASLCSAADHRAEVLKEAAPADDLSPKIAAELAGTGIRVIRGQSATLCDIWLCKQVDALPDFKPTTEVLYPFKPGQLIGVVRYSRKGSDFRDQDIESGTYTMRYAQQPVDGAHVGTSPTRDFLLLTSAKKDQDPAILDYKPLTKQSAESAGSSHPLLLSLQRVATEATEFPAIRHNEDHDWWILAMQAPTKAGGADSKPLVCELVVAGIASE